MSDNKPINIQEEIDDANANLPMSVSSLQMPLDMTVRSVALTIAQRHCSDSVVKEGNLYQHLKMDNRLSGPLTLDHVIHCARIFERFLWGEWSKGIAGQALTDTMNELDEALNQDFKDEEPTRPTGGGATP